LIKSGKKAGSVDKKLYWSLEQQYSGLAQSPNLEPECSPFGPLSNRSSRKILIFLISTMNHSFPDFDFSNVKADDFLKEVSYHLIIHFINNLLSSISLDEATKFQNKLWTAIDHEIKLQECSIYSFIPDPDSDPFASEGNIWSFNYFFYNKKLNRVVFFTGQAFQKHVLKMTRESLNFDSNDTSDSSEMSDDDEDFQMDL